MKPNNLVALLVVAILLATGIALAVINKRSVNEAPQPGSKKITYSTPASKPFEKGASDYS